MAVTDVRDKVAIVGVGNTRYARKLDMDIYAMGAVAFKNALEDSGLSKGDIDGLIVNRIPYYLRMGEILGINPKYSAQLPTQGRMAGASLQLAVMAIYTGMANCIACVYGMESGQKGVTYGGGPGLSAPFGMTSYGGEYAFMFRRHMELYGTTSRQLAAVAVAQRKHASLNPNAIMRKVITVEDHQNSRFIVEPLHLFDYCMVNDGGACIILTTAERAKDLKRPPVYIAGMGRCDTFVGSSILETDFWRRANNECARQAYSMAGITPKDVDALYVYDNFSPHILFVLEGYGFCPVGESGAWIQGGRIELGGELPINTSGGHLSESYMTGFNHFVEAVRQLRGECGERQVKDAEIVQYACATPCATSLIFWR